ncbi:MAG: DUF4340 domain-containing protein [Saprospiraceae bacterium]|nr:DUF4340 domain-containing protein [Saprospiraceae bacterium]
MKKTNLILLLVLAIVGSAGAWYLTTKKESNLEGYDFHFAIKDTADVAKIFLADRTGKTVTLVRKDKVHWMVGNNYDVQPDMIKTLLETLNQVELKFRLPRNAVASVVKDIATEGIKVEVYNGSGKNLRTFYVGGTTSDDRGTFMMMENSNEPYVMHIPGFQGMLRPRFLTEEQDWRERFAFKLRPEDIKMLSVEYPTQKAKSFKLIREGIGFKVEPFYDVVPRINRPPVSGMIDAYLQGFSKLGIEGYEAGNPKADSLKNSPVFARISITTKDNKAKTLNLHPFLERNEQGQVMQSPDGSVHIEHYFVDTSEGELMAVQHFVFQKVFWAYEAFFVNPSIGR